MGALRAVGSQFATVATRLWLVGADLFDRRSPVATWLVCLLLIVFAAQTVVGRLAGGSAATVAGGLFLEYEVWAWSLSVLLHRNLLHLGANVGLLWLLGRVIEPIVGRRRFLALLAALAVGSVLGGFLFTAALVDRPVAVYGASGLAFGLATFTVWLPATNTDAGGVRSTICVWRRFDGCSPAEKLAVLVGLAAIATVLVDVVTGPAFTAYWINGGHAGGAAVGLVAGGWFARSSSGRGS